MTDEKLFSSGDQTTDTGEVVDTTTQPQLVLPDNVKELIGPGKKYSDVATALAALGHSQDHIQRIEAENRQFREQAAQAVDTNKMYETLQEILKKERDTHGSAPLDVASIEALLDRKLSERERVQAEASNADLVRSELVKKYATKEKAQEIFDAREKELGTDLTKLAKTSPRAALLLLGITGESHQTPAPSRGSVNSEALKRTPDGVERPRKSVLAGSTTKDLLEAWKAAAPKTS